MATQKRTQASTTRRDLVVSEILEKASALFAERGFADTSLQDLAQAVGTSRTSLYHYIGGKEQLLTTLVRGLTPETAATLDQIRAAKLSSVERLHAAIFYMATRIATNPARFRLLAMSESSLPSALAAEHRDTRVQVLRHLTAIIRAGMEDGELRAADEHVAAFSILGMCNWVAWWYRPERPGAPTVEELASQIADQGVASLRATTARRPTGPLGVQHAIDLLREDLEYLQKVADT